MVWDVTMPSLLGYLSGMLWNQNNVDSSTSPVTTEFETTVGKQLCEMLGFREGICRNIKATISQREFILYLQTVASMIFLQMLCLLSR